MQLYKTLLPAPPVPAPEKRLKQRKKDPVIIQLVELRRI
jgi:hypothetical protein